MPNQLQQYATSAASHRVLLYTGLSVGAVVAVVVNALRRHSNFYSVAVYLSKSNGAVVVIANFGLLLALLAGRLLQQIFFGPLRAMEVERLYDRMWFFITESLLAFTIFRDEFDIPFALMFGLLLFMKCFHWLLSDRIEWMDQRPYPGPPLLFHIRVHALVSLLWVTDLAVFLLTLENMYTHGVGGTVLFASEYAILLASLGNSVAKYAIALIDLRRASLRGGENAPPWEDKSMLIFYVELATDFLKLVTYLTFFMLVLTFYGLPLNIVRDVYITARSFIMRFRDLIRYRTATRNMDERYPDATEEELNGMTDRTCIICREEMVQRSQAPAPEGTGESTRPPPSQDGPNTTPKKLPCGHIFHFYCLRSWLERQQSCPTCRRSVLEVNEAPRANGQVARPQNQVPAVPPAPNGVAPGQAFQWQPDQQGNRGRLFGRLIGGGGMPPMGHGQFAPVPMPGQAPQPPQQEFTPVTQSLPYPRPSVVQGERFQGFFTPDGVWHPWPSAQEHADDRTQNAPNDRLAATTSSAENTDNQSPGAGHEGAAAERTASASASPSATSEFTNAREAASTAALRRLSPSNANLRSRASSEVNTPAQSEAVAGPSIENGSGEVPSTVPDANDNSTSPNTVQRTAAPAFIPLFDPHISSPPLTRLSSRLPFGGIGRGLTSFQRSEQNSLSSRRRDVGPLPPVLTDEQLRSLDRLTREAIDERLRILENVQATSTRCVIDLLRCRSMLPRSSAASGSAPNSTDDLTNEGLQNTSDGPSSMSGQESLAEASTSDDPHARQPVETGA